MEMTLKKELVMTEEERETIQKIVNILNSDDALYFNGGAATLFDVLISIAQEDYETLKDEYNYYVEIRG